MGKLIQNNIHHLLLRQLKKSDVTIEQVPEHENWKNFLLKVNSSYIESDQERYLLERSLKISSNEMHALHKKTKRRAKQWIKDISNTYPDMLILLSEDGIVLDLLSSSGFENLLIDPYEIENNQPIEFVFEANLSELIRKHISKINPNHNNESFEFVFKRSQSDTVYEIRLISTNSINDNNLFCLIRDISDLAESNNKLKHLAHHDSLTGLPNRLGYYKKLNSIIKNCLATQFMGAVLYFDLDRFKSVNDSLGHRIGDQLIIAVSERIPTVLEDNEFFARMSGDEFIIVIYNKISEDKIYKRAKNILSAFIDPFVLGSHQIEVKASIGISLFPQHSMDADILTQFADTAMYSAKAIGGNQFEIFNEKQNSSVKENFNIEQGLRRAIERKEMFMVYQPQYCVQSKTITGYEALIRWNSKDDGLISPLKFIAIAELTGFIDDLGIWIINEVFEQISKWRILSFNFSKISINLSRIQLIDPNLVSSIFILMKKYKIKRTEIVFEITEDSIITNNQVAMKNLIQLQHAGLNIAIDDFGTGYSSFFDLKIFQFSELKIDKSIIDGVGKDQSDDAIVRAIIAIGNEMNMKIVAEGVETEQQFNFLKKNHCDTIQGYLFSKPLKVSEVQ